jgi:restriction system protein
MWTAIDGRHIVNALHTYWWALVPCAALLGYVFRGRREYWYANRGEALVRSALIKQLPAESWHLLNNVTLQLTDGTTQIDHVLVSRYGVFVIETKHYKGWVFGDEKSKQWTQVIYRQKHRFQNPLHQNYKHLKAVQALLDFLQPEQIVGVVVFTGDAEFKSHHPAGVYSLEGLLTYLKGHDQPQITLNRMQFCVGRLECTRLALTRETDLDHRANLEARHGTKSR